MKRFFLLIIGFWIFLGGYAQEGKEIQLYKQAEDAYNIGCFNEAIKVLNDNMEYFSKRTKETALRLLALCYLEEDKYVEAEQYVSMLLKYNPYYTVSFSDPLRFADMLERLKKGQVTITTASQQAENIDESPVPITLITEEMIEAIGARTLKDVLIVYVPGITSVESLNEVNVSMHGVYSAGQEKILIMLNGQRMNARSTNKAAPDYSISLDKVKRIEVLRGPASSLYGNVALMAVVNMITKDGGEIDGAEILAGLGNFGQKKGSIVIGRRFLDIDFMSWASVYVSDGQKRFIPQEKAVGKNPHDGYAWVEGYNRMPSYDFGFTFKWNQFSINFNQRYGKKVPTYSDIHTSMGALYDYNKYKVFGNEGPGYGMAFTHAGISYSNRYKNIDFNAELYLDNNRSNQYSLVGDSVSTNAVDNKDLFSFYQIMEWSEISIGASVFANYSYPQIEKFGSGSLLFGIQTEYMKLNAAEGLVGNEYNKIYKYWPTNPVQLGSESTFSPFVQLKHSFSKKWILNAGARYDIKRRVNKNMVSSLSPRISLVYLPNPKINVKLNYARSFVDAPYFYRYNQSPSYKGPEDMNPEYMEAIQACFTYQSAPAFSINSVLFYNNLTGLIYRDQTAVDDQPRYINGGVLQTMGWENSFQYQTPRFFSNLNLTFQRALSAKNYNMSDHRIYNVPNWYMNLSVNGNILKRSNHEVWLYANGRITGKQLSPINNVLIGGELVTDLDNELPALFLMNMGMRYRFKKIELELATYNLFDKTYYQGGSTPVPYIQQGFSMMGTLRYLIRK